MATQPAARPGEGPAAGPGAGLRLVPRPVAGSVEELLAGAQRQGVHEFADSRSSASFERVVIDGEVCFVKYVHPDLDFTMRVSGDVGCRPLRVWATGLMDIAPDLIEHGHLGAAPWGRNGWGAALLMRDLSADMAPLGDVALAETQHATLIDACAGLCARSWGWHDDQGLLPYRLRWAWFGSDQMAGEAALGFPEAVPRIATEGWSQFEAKAPAEVATAVSELRRDPTPLAEALRATPSCFLHGDWKLGNLGVAGDGRAVLIDWNYPGEGPACHELSWHLALNRSRLPLGVTKEETLAMFRQALERHGVDTGRWWDRQVGLCLLGAVVQFGWEKALGEGEDGRTELGWWTDAARDGLRFL